MLRSLKMSTGNFKMFLFNQSKKYGLKDNKSLFGIQRSEFGFISNIMIDNQQEIFCIVIVELKIIFSPITNENDKHRQC